MGRFRIGTELRAWALAVAAAIGSASPAGADAARRPILTGDDRAAGLARAAAAASPTVASLVEELGSGDVIVVVEVTREPFDALGDLRLQAVAGGVRYLRIRVKADLKRWEQIAMLGHELQHAREVAQAPDVRDEASLARLMRRIGREVYKGRFETAAAIEVADRVRREIAR
jgi:hypothetical protein